MGENKVKLTIEVDAATGATTVKSITQAVDELGKKTEQSSRQGSDALSYLGNTWTKIATQISVYGVAFDKVAGVVNKGIALMNEGAKALRVEGAFKSMADSADVDTGRLLASMKRASRGVVEDTNLMQKALFAMSQDIDPEAIPKLMEAARVSSRKTGDELISSINKVVDAVSTNMPRSLRQMGLVTKEQMALLSKAAADGATEVKLLDIVIANAAVTAAKLGPPIENATTRIQRLNVQIGETKEFVGKTLIDAIDTAMPYIERFFVRLADAGGAALRVVQGAGQMTSLPARGPFVRMPVGTNPATLAAAEAEKARVDAELKAASERAKAQKDAETLAKERARLEEEASHKMFLEGGQAYEVPTQKQTLEMEARSQERLNKALEDRNKLEEQATHAGFQQRAAQGLEYETPTEKQMAEMAAESGKWAASGTQRYMQYNLAALQTMLHDFETTEEEKRKITAAIEKKIQQDQVGTYDALKAGWNDLVFGMRGKFQATAQYIMDFGRNMGESLHSSISDTFYAGFTGKLNSISSIWSNFTSNLKNSFFRMASDIASKKIIMYFTSMFDESKGSIWGKGTIENLLGIDVPILTFAGGGSVPGAWNGKKGPAGDTIPAMLTPGEYVMRRDVMQNPEMGAFIKALNRDATGYGSVSPGRSHYGFWDDVASFITSGLTDLVGITNSKNVPSLGSYIKGMVDGSQGFDIFELIARLVEPQGWVRGGTRWLGAAMGKDWAGTAGFLGPLIGAAVGGPWGAAAGSDIASEFQVGAYYGVNPGHEDVNEKQHFMNAAIAFIAAKAAQGAGDYVKTPEGVAKVPAGSVYTDAAGQTWLQEAGTGAEWAVERASYIDVAKASINGAWERAQQTGEDFWGWLSKLPDMSAGEAWDRASGSLVDYLGASWEKIANLPNSLFDQLMNFDPLNYVKSRSGDILSKFKLMLSGMSGGELLDTSSIASALGIGQIYAAANGTGLEGLPYTGPFIGHRNEIVLNAAESEAVRRGASGAGGDLNISLNLDGRVIARTSIMNFRTMPEFRQLLREVR